MAEIHDFDYWKQSFIRIYDQLNEHEASDMRQALCQTGNLEVLWRVVRPCLTDEERKKFYKPLEPRSEVEILQINELKKLSASFIAAIVECGFVFLSGQHPGKASISIAFQRQQKKAWGIFRYGPGCVAGWVWKWKIGLGPISIYRYLSNRERRKREMEFYSVWKRTDIETTK